MAHVLVIDDDKMVCETLKTLISSQGHQTESALTLKEGMEKNTATTFDLVFLDINLPDGSGLDAVADFRQVPSRPEIIIITGEGGPDNAALAMKSDAWDYVRKPLSIQDVLLPLTRALQYRREKAEQKPPRALRRTEIIGNSPPVNACLDLVAKAAGTDTSVLITGETGTGKELFARAIHANSERAGEDFVVVDCASLPATLVESILFGHEKGTFTGAEQAREGLFHQAHRGTLFLDEVGELPPDTQKSLLRVLQEQRFRPIGSSREVESHFRLVAATNRDLEALVAGGDFRRDLLYRLRGFAINLPPLKQRGEDVVELALAQLNKLSKHYRIPTKGLCPGFMETLRNYDWPGNVRELFNAVGAAFVQAKDEPTLFSMHLPADVRAGAKLKQVQGQNETGRHPLPAASASGNFDLPPPPPLKAVREKSLVSTERRYLFELLSYVNRDMNEACAISGLSRSQLYRLLQKHGVQR
ncbi:sigma-54-dependent transcriptional regulator [Desulfurivibrio alkaliphilus]|uniref:Putative two component, sigma54 specific, transcriptional regulator, Fis family n=1 Tax=Desulfurivibrio alkaliphilus (strain DSM 19089 / UNIQEM U267 / AHT2) TaxID=589865 RepID=D6Z204_DESAT|nr:putative two component, sigma54 specific, transcriptional regulator, Fis family [Desulfurivibrio alkaliphilus AHT 2]